MSNHSTQIVHLLVCFIWRSVPLAGAGGGTVHVLRQHTKTVVRALRNLAKPIISRAGHFKDLSDDDEDVS